MWTSPLILFLLGIPLSLASWLTASISWDRFFEEKWDVVSVFCEFASISDRIPEKKKRFKQMFQLIGRRRVFCWNSMNLIEFEGNCRLRRSDTVEQNDSRNRERVFVNRDSRFLENWNEQSFSQLEFGAMKIEKVILIDWQCWCWTSAEESNSKEKHRMIRHAKSFLRQKDRFHRRSAKENCRENERFVSLCRSSWKDRTRKETTNRFLIQLDEQSLSFCFVHWSIDSLWWLMQLECTLMFLLDWWQIQRAR